MIAGTFGGWNRNESGADTVIAHCAPKIRAMQIISELEGTTRGPYAGCVGYFSCVGCVGQPCQEQPSTKIVFHIPDFLEALRHAAEVIADNGQFNCVTKLPWPLQQRAPEKPPVSHPPAIPDAQQPERLNKRAEIRPRQP